MKDLDRQRGIETVIDKGRYKQVTRNPHRILRGHRVTIVQVKPKIGLKFVGSFDRLTFLGDDENCSFEGVS